MASKVFTSIAKAENDKVLMVISKGLHVLLISGIFHALWNHQSCCVYLL